MEALHFDHCTQQRHLLNVRGIRVSLRYDYLSKEHNGIVRCSQNIHPSSTSTESREVYRSFHLSQTYAFCSACMNDTASLRDTACYQERPY
jgi:hypothetical protein